MAAPQRKRFVCPLCEDTRLAPSRMARDDVRRFCLGCSERTGKLVARVSPVLERQRQRSKDRATKKVAAKRRRGAPARRQQAGVNKRVREHAREEFGALRDWTELIEKRTVRTDHSSATLRRLGYVGGAYSGELHKAGVTLLASSSSGPALWAPAWAHWLYRIGRETTETHASVLKVIRFVAQCARSREALEAAMATGERVMTLRLALDLYPFPVVKALRNAIRGDNA